MECIPSLEIKTEMDPCLEDALKEAELKQNLTPLIKQELKYTILNRRHKSGQGDLVIEEKKAQPKRELTPEEIRKKLRRKEQNRRAAARCRQKKKHIAETVITEYLKEQQNAAALQKEIDQLRRDKEMLERILNEHAFTCTRAITPTPITPNYEDQSTFQYGVSPNPYQNRDSATPFQDLPDPFDDTMQFLPEVPPCLKVQVPVPVSASGNQATCVTQQSGFPDIALSELDLPESLLDFSLFTPGSPDVQHGGRTSISDYVDVQ